MQKSHGAVFPIILTLFIIASCNAPHRLNMVSVEGAAMRVEWKRAAVPLSPKDTGILRHSIRPIKRVAPSDGIVMISEREGDLSVMLPGGFSFCINSQGFVAGGYEVRRNHAAVKRLCLSIIQAYGLRTGYYKNGQMPEVVWPFDVDGYPQEAGSKPEKKHR